MNYPEPPITLAVRRAALSMAEEAGERVSSYVRDRLLRTLPEIAAGAEAAGVRGESALACYLHLCWAACEELREDSAAGMN